VLHNRSYFDGTNDSLTIKGTGRFQNTLTLATGTNSIAPLVIPSGTLTSTPASGYIENNGSTLYYTDSTGTRKVIFVGKDGVEQVYNDTITWTGTTPPSGTATNTYQWVQTGKLVTLRMNFAYGFQGTSITLLSMPLPSDCPMPLVPSGFSGASNLLYIGNAYTQSTLNTFGAASTSRSVLRINAANNGYEILLATTSVSFKFGWLTIQYLTV
jgi:hypothetical protein